MLIRSCGVCLFVLQPSNLNHGPFNLLELKQAKTPANDDKNNNHFNTLTVVLKVAVG